MLSPAYKHLDWARQNEDFANSLSETLHINVDANWAVTALFYAAVHYVDAYFVARGSRPVDHEERERKIADDGFFGPVRKSYKELKRKSRSARYEMAPYGKAEFEDAKRLLGQIRDLVMTKFPEA